MKDSYLAHSITKAYNKTEVLLISRAKDIEILPTISRLVADIIIKRYSPKNLTRLPNPGKKNLVPAISNRSHKPGKRTFDWCLALTRAKANANGTPTIPHHPNQPPPIPTLPPQ